MKKKITVFNWLLDYTYLSYGPTDTLNCRVTNATKIKIIMQFAF